MRWPNPFRFKTGDRASAISAFVREVTGHRPNNPALYRLAFQHISTLRNGQLASHESNERLEFLGDAILGSVIAEYLFKKYPNKPEGFLTEMRSKIVNRGQLNEIALKLGLDSLLVYDRGGNWQNRSIFGNTLEAFIGAVYLDQGYRRTRSFIVEKLLSHFVDVHQLAEVDSNYKSRLMEFVQKNKLAPIRYELVAEENLGAVRQFTVAVKIGDKILGYGTDTKKKFAEQKASGEALVQLNVIAPNELVV
ncbi:MAG: ribonuclease III [Bacteroidia bacterium]|nr:ribonuclease III [Bacteroidia bacterium]